ncbi:MAG: adenylate kinase [Candidatus Lokiarchaeota archaeon]|nr:adenylate kinase [Candidatus Lokiarchaeota archaeon]
MEQNLKINVVGTSSSGKTTFCRKLSRILSILHIEMDALFWGPNWCLPTDEEFFPKLRLALKGDSWILDGNYTRSIPIKWESVTTIIWLDFSFLRTLYQAVNRAIKRIITREEIWPGTGNREALKSLFSKDSIVLFMIKSYRKFRPFYEPLIKSGDYSNIQFIRLRSPREVKLFLTRVKKNRDLIFDRTTS